MTEDGERTETHDAPRRQQKLDAEVAQTIFPRAHFEADGGTHPRRCSSAAEVQVPPQQRNHESIVDRAWAFLVPQIRDTIAEMFQALIQERIHEDIVDPSIPRGAVVGRGKKDELGVREKRRMTSFRRCRRTRS